MTQQADDRAALWRKFISILRDDRYDVHIFEILPLHIKMSVIEEGVVLHSRDVLELYEYFYPFRREGGGPKAQAYACAGGYEILDCSGEEGERPAANPEGIAKF